MTLVWHFVSIEIRNGARARARGRDEQMSRAAYVNLRTAPRRPLAGICARRFAFVRAVRLRSQVIASGRPCDRSKSDRTDAAEARARTIAIDGERRADGAKRGEKMPTISSNALRLPFL